MLIDKKRLKLVLVAIIYIFIIFIISNSELTLANIILGISLIIGVMFVYDTSKSIFSIKNIFLYCISAWVSMLGIWLFF